MSRLLFACAVATLTAFWVAAQAPPSVPPKVVRAVGAAPDNMSRVGNTLTGSYFVATPLKWKYDALLAKLDALKRDLDADRVAGPEAAKSLAELRAGLKELREQIDKSKVMVAAVQAHTRTEAVSFDIGPDRTVVVKAERVRLVGTDGDKIVCTLEKVYLGGDAKEADAQLAAVKVTHARKTGYYPQGKSEAEGDAEEAAFRMTPAGRKLSPDDYAHWGRQRARSRAMGVYYRGFWGKEADVVTVEGVDSQSDSVVEIRSDSKGGEGITRQVRRRHATLTVAVPKCQRVSVEHASGSLEVVGLHGSLLFFGAHGGGSAYREPDNRFTIKGVRGDVDAISYPFTAIEGVTGNVNLLSVEDTGVKEPGPGAYEKGLATLNRGRPMACSIKDIGGDLTGRFGRADIHVEGVRGAVAVVNNAGDTKLVVKTPLAAAAAHRLTSVTGTIDVSFGPGALGELPVVAASTHGNVRVKSLAVEVAGIDTSDFFEFGDNYSGYSLNLMRISDPLADISRRVSDALRPGDKSPGLVIRTLAGHVAVTVADK